MSDLVIPSTRERLAGKWQIPTLFVALALLAGSLTHLKSAPEPLHAAARLEQLAARVEDGYYASAIEYGERLSKAKSLTPAEQGAIQLQLAAAHYLQAERQQRTTAEAARPVLEAYAAAEGLGAAPSADDLVRLGNAHAWAGEYAAAVAGLQKAVEARGDAALPIRRRIIELSIEKLNRPPAEVLALLETFATDAADDPAALAWAAETRVDVLAAEGRHAEALAFLENLRDRLASTPAEDLHEYLVDLTLYRLGRYDEAELRLRALRERVARYDPLYVRSGWLLGRVVLSDGEPQRPAEALSFFTEVLNLAPGTVYECASRVGLAEALAALARFDEALKQYRHAVDRLGALGGSPVFSAEGVRASATVVAEQLRLAGRLEAALPFYELAEGLVPDGDTARLVEYWQWLSEVRAAVAQARQAEAEALAARGAEDAERRHQLQDEAHALWRAAGETALKLARPGTLPEARSADAAWRAADLFDAAGDPQRTLATLEEFLRERPESELLPRVLLRLGQTRQTLGAYAEAIEAYQENLRRFPRTPDAGSGLIPLARCYMALGGPENAGLAEKTLVDHILADSPVFTPEAPEFRDALFLLGELYGSTGRYEPSITVLEEALERYAADERAERARFLLADAYRHSALALKADIQKTEKASEWPRLRAEMGARFERAAVLFADLVHRTAGSGEQNLDALQKLVLQQARLYQADCLFELGRYEEAVALYETSAFIYRNEPSALSAYVQVINCRLSLGQVGEAHAALRRAQYLLKIMPDRMFENGSGTQTRAEWERFLGWLEQARLLNVERS